MTQIPSGPSPPRTVVLLVEADPDARSRHEGLLASVGYSVICIASFPDAREVQSAAVVIADLAWFHWFQAQHFDRAPPILVVADDLKEGITACLCGADDWIPSYGEPGYMLGTVEEALSSHR
jgi:DNA-binding response OmpR family regulator